MRGILLRVLIGMAVIALGVLAIGCITGGDKDPVEDTMSIVAGGKAGIIEADYSVVVLGFLSEENEISHGNWFVEIPKGEVITLKIRQFNGTLWEYTDYCSVSGGVIIRSTPNPLSLGMRYRLELRPF